MNLLETVAGKESALAIYDVGSLSFVYLTRMDQPSAETTPLWLIRGRFEQRNEAGSVFFVRQDPESRRVAAFAVQDGWLILGTREDLVAGVLDRLHHEATQDLAGEAWFAGAVQQAAEPSGDLRMLLNLGKLVAMRPFDSYWVQQNDGELKQYSAAVSDLYCEAPAWREQRTMLREPQPNPRPPGTDVSSLAALAPAGTTFWSARAAPSTLSLLTMLRDDLLDPQPSSTSGMAYAPPLATAESAGASSDLETRIDRSPALATQSDPWRTLREMLVAAQPSGVLSVYEAGPAPTGIFIPIHHAVVVASARDWNMVEVQEALTAALHSRLAVSQLGIGWVTRSGPEGGFEALDGQITLLAAARNDKLFLANDAAMLSSLLANAGKTATEDAGVTYAAVFNHSDDEQATFRNLFGLLDRAGSRGSADGAGDVQRGEPPAFFSGNLASLSRVFSAVSQVRMEERDQGAKVSESVRYLWKR
ncbi:MAG TPA: hypothetical protein VN515_05255 [Terriglobales bacterium]|nr:hypothetical protein [Terriglobales bacterium]